MNGNESLTTTEIKKQNCKKVFDYLYQNQRTSKQTIAQALGLSMPTVSQNLKLLEGAGWSAGTGFTSPPAAERPTCCALCRTPGWPWAWPFWRGACSCAPWTCWERCCGRRPTPCPMRTATAITSRWARLVRGLMAHLPYGKERVLGVGIAIQGLVSADGERVVYGAILNNNGVTREMFQRYIPYPCRLLHDTEVGAAAEFWHNQEIRDAIYLVLNRNMAAPWWWTARSSRAVASSST